MQWGLVIEWILLCYSWIYGFGSQMAGWDRFMEQEEKKKNWNDGHHTKRCVVEVFPGQEVCTSEQN